MTDATAMIDGVGRRMSRGRRHAAGFTLIELMIVVAVVAILAAIAYPSYQDSVIKSRRKAAAGCLTEAAQYMERYYTTNMSYKDADTLPATSCATDLAKYYTIGIAASEAMTYQVQAVPTAAQNDAKCGTLSVDQKGTKGKTGSAAAATDCW